MKKILFILLCISSTKLLACEFSLPKTFNITTDLIQNKSYSYNANNYDNKLNVFRAFNCQKLAMTRKLLMIAVGPELLEFSDQVSGFSFNDRYYPSKCTIKNSPVPLITFEEKVKLFKKKKKYLNKCLNIIVEDEGRQPIKYPKDQPGCEITKINKNKVQFSGGYCFFNVNLGSSFTVRTLINDNCKSLAGLKKQNLKPLDINSVMNFYSTGDETGNSSQLSQLQTLPLRIMTNSVPELVSTAVGFGYKSPKYPANWMDPNIHPAQIKISRGVNNNVLINTPFFVDNRCEKKCNDDGCMSPCDFSQPVVSRMDLYAVEDKKDIYLSTWYDGGVARPDFQGLINGIGFELPKSLMQENKKFKLNYTIDDPKFDFENFKKRIKSKFGKIEQHLPRIGRSSISDIPLIREVVNIQDFPTISEIFGINFNGNTLNKISSTSNSLREYLGYKFWPPYFEKACLGVNNCKKIKNNLKTITVNFEIKYDESKRQWNVLESNYSMQSNLNGLKIEKQKLPELVCGKNI